MPGDLAAEGGAFLAHPVFEEGVPDAVHERHTAGAFDGLRHGPARPNVVQDLRARLLLEDRLGEQRRDEIARDEFAAVVDEETAVGVTVERDPEIGVLLRHLAHDELTVLRQQWVRLVVGERAVGVEEAAHGVDRQPVQDRRQHRAGHPVGRVDHDTQRLHGIDVDEGQDAVDELRPDVLLRDRLGGTRLLPGT